MSWINVQNKRRRRRQHHKRRLRWLHRALTRRMGEAMSQIRADLEAAGILDLPPADEWIASLD